jgi:hypothetical protein
MIDILFNYTEILTNVKEFRFTAALQFRLLTLLCSSVNFKQEKLLIKSMKH